MTKTVIEICDYHLDHEGIVNNGHYFNFFEHARHLSIKEVFGVSFVELLSQGYSLVLAETSIKYLRPLRSGDFITIQTKFSFNNDFQLDCYQSALNKQTGDFQLLEAFSSTLEPRPVLRCELEH